MRGDVDRFEPAMEADVRDARLAGWKKAVEAVLGQSPLSQGGVVQTLS
jgi:hypothetical protein